MVLRRLADRFPRSCSARCGFPSDNIDRMATPEDVAALRDAVAPLCAPLHEIIESADELAQAHFSDHDMDGSEYTRWRSDLTRAHVFRLSGAVDLGDWKRAPQSGPGNISLNRGMMQLRLLCFAPGGRVSSPGSNPARLRYYLNPPATLFGVDDSRLVASYSVDPETGECFIQITRPTGHWGHGRSSVADIEFELPRTIVDLERLEFMPDDNEIELPFDFGDGDEGLGHDNADGR